MAEGLTTSLFLTALCIGIIGFWITSRDISYQIALPVTVVKILIPVIYFSYCYDGTWTMLDDINYFNHGVYLLKNGFNPVTALITSNGMDTLITLSEGPHILYAWWNLLSMYLFGSHYYAPVFMNILLTFVSGFFFVKILSDLGFSQQYRKLFLVFFLLHWDILAWSSLINIKDLFVTALTIIALYLIIKFVKKPRIHEFIGLALIIYVFYWIRFYIPLLLLGATGLWMFIAWKNRKKYIFIPITIVIIYFYYPLLGDQTVYLNFSSIFQGMFKFILTPQPWSIENEYSFLIFPSIFHWIFIVPAIISFITIWIKYSYAKIALIYFLLTVLLYTVTPILQGPRQRIQIVFILAWMQFHFIWVLVRNLNTAIKNSHLSEMASVSTHRLEI